MSFTATELEVLESEDLSFEMARRQIAIYSAHDPQYAAIVESIRRAISSRGEIFVGYRVLLRGDNHTACEDDAFVLAAAASLGMGTRNMPSVQYRDRR